MTRTIRRHGLVATISGDGPPLLLVHGLGAARHIWRANADRLSRDFTTIAVDLPGHGDSDWPSPVPKTLHPADHAAALKPLIDDFSDGQISVVGNSMGGWIGLEIAANGWASSLTALCPAGLEFDPWVSRSDILVLRRRLAQVLGPVMPPATEMVANTPILRDLLIGDATANFTTLDKSVLADAAIAMRQARGFYGSHDGMLNCLFTRAEEVPKSTPVSIVWGSQDSLLPPERQRRVAGPSHASWIVLDQCAHVPMWDQPRRTVEIITETTRRGINSVA